MNPRNIPHVRQSDSQRNCGAACLAMIYRAYRKKGKLNDITARVSGTLSNGMPTCELSLMAQDAVAQGFECMAVSAINIRELIPYVFNCGASVIILYHPSLHESGGHMAVVTGTDEENVYVNDPALDAPLGVGKPIKYDDLEILMKATDTADEEIRVDNGILLLAKKDSVNLVLTLNEIKAVLVPARDAWVLP